MREAAAEHLQDRYLSALASLLKSLGKSLFDGVCHSKRTKKNRNKKTEILRHLDMKFIGAKSVRLKFLKALGISETETQRKDEIRGPLDELKASNLLSGPFRLVLTENPSEHLTFTGSHTQS